MVSVEVLGPLRVRRDGEEIRLTSPTQRLLLGVLAAAYPDVVPRHRLIDAVWADPPPSAENSLHSHLSRLRRSLGPGVVERSGDGYQLTIAPDAGPGTQSDAAWLAEWRGRAFGDLADHPMVRPAAQVLEEQRRRVRLRRAARAVREQRSRETVSELRALVTEDPHDEHAWALLVRALGDTGRRTEALRAAHDAYEWLGEVGLTPGGELARAEDELLHEAAPSPTGATLPRYRSGFHGRRRELASVGDLLHTREWVTIVGPGGVGKTRLAVEAAARLEGRTAVLCDLSGLTEPADVEPAITHTLGTDAVPPLGPRIAEALTHRGIVLVLDNCEQVQPAVAALGATLARVGTADSRVLATSRSPLGIDGEALVELDPLTVDAATALLRERAADLGVAVSDQEARDVCELGDRLPLAVEMLASVLRTLTADELLEREEHRLDLLGSDRQEGRHRTLESTITSSVNLLGPAERTAFARLSLFAGPFSLSQAERLVPGGAIRVEAVPRLVATLRDQSLLSPAPGASGHRHRMLATVRDVALRLLPPDDQEALRRRHLHLFVEATEAIDQGLRGPDELTWVRFVDASLDDLRAAHRAALDHGWVDDDACLVAGLFHLVYSRVRPDLGVWADDVLAVGTPTDRASHSRLLATAALAAFQVADLTRAASLASAAVECAGDDPVARFGALVLANLALARGDLPEAVRRGSDAQRHAEAVGDHYTDALGRVLATLGKAYAGEADAALHDAAAERRVAASTGSATISAYTDYLEGEVLAARDPMRAAELLRRSIRTATEADVAVAEGVARTTLSSLEAQHGDPDAALAGFTEAIRLFRDRGDVQRLLVTLRNLGALLARLGRDADAAYVLGALEANAPPPYGREAERLRSLRAELVRRLGDDAEARFADGRCVPRAELLRHCLSLVDVT